LPFLEPGGGGSQATLPLSMRAMPMTPPSDGPSGSVADVEAAHETADGQSSGKTDVGPKKTASVVQAVIAEEQLQMEMDFERQSEQLVLPDDLGDEQARLGLDRLDELERALVSKSDV